MSRPAALGFDVGTTAVKAGLRWLDTSEPMLVFSQPYPTAQPRPGWVEQDARDWLAAMAACWAELGQRTGPVELRSVGLVSQVNTHLLTDAALQPLRPAITWQDTRAADEANELDAAVAGRRRELWGGPFTIDPSFSLARLRWLERHEPDVHAAARWLLLPRDYCVAALTGEVVGDPLSPVGLVGPGDHYLDGVLGLVDGSVDLLPPLRPVASVAGVTVADNPVGLPPGVPVAVGTMDAWGSIFGAGLLTPGRAMDVAGTSEIVGVSSGQTIPTEGIVSFPPFQGVHVHAGPTQAGGAALDWVAGLLGVSVPEALALAEAGARDPQPIVFLPHLAGERAPYWNPEARGVFLGLTTSTEPRHLALAVLEGVAFAVRMLTELCQAAAGDDVPAVRACGGGARSTTWNQVKATVLGRPLEVLETLDAGVLGAAVVGAAAADADPDLAARLEASVSVAGRVEPLVADQARAGELYGVYQEAYRALVPVFPGLAAAGPASG